MPAFAYVARDASGATRKGQLDAGSRTGAADALRRSGLTLVALEPARGARSLDPRALLPILRVDIEHGLRQLAVMYRAGLTVTEALVNLADSSGARVGRLWQAVAARVREGQTFGDALAAQTRIPPLVVALVRVGEQTGELDVVLERAAETLARQRRLRAALTQALFYPVLVILAAVGVAAAMVFYLVPKLERMLTGFGRQLPWTTQVLVDTSHWLQIHGIGLAIGLAGAAGVLVAVYCWPPGRLGIDTLLLRTPVVGGTIRLAGSVLFCRAMSTLVSSGVSMIESLTTLEGLLINRDQQATIADVRARVASGGEIAPALREGGTFIPLVPQLVATGERTGALDTVLDQLGDYADDRLQRRIRWLSALVEPAMIIVVGVIVGFVYFAFFQAVYGAVGSVR